LIAATLARLDGSVTRDEALAHAAHLVAAVDVPVTADLENGFADEPAAVAVTVTPAAELGLAGCSIEDNGSDGIYDPELAADRVAAAVEAAAGRLILTARADNFLHDRNDLADTITRLQRFQDAGADVPYAPGLTRREDIAAVIHSVDRPVNVLLLPDGPTVTELATLGVSRVSIGGTFTYAAFGALEAQAARELHGPGPYTFWDRAAQGRDLIQGPSPCKAANRCRVANLIPRHQPTEEFQGSDLPRPQRSDQHNAPPRASNSCPRDRSQRQHHLRGIGDRSPAGTLVSSVRHTRTLRNAVTADTRNCPETATKLPGGGHENCPTRFPSASPRPAAEALLECG